VPSPYTVLFTPAAGRDLKRIDSPLRELLLERCAELADDPRPHGVKKGVGEDWHRIRVNDYRIKYEIDDDARTVTVIRAGHRRDVYD